MNRPVTGALALIRQRVEQQQIIEIERKVARKHAQECYDKANARVKRLLGEFQEAQESWALTPREQRMWQKKLAAATEILVAATARLEQTPER